MQSLFDTRCRRSSSIREIERSVLDNKNILASEKPNSW